MIPDRLDFRVNTAPSQAHVLSISRRYVEAWPTTELARLPEGCRPLRIVAAADIHYWALALRYADAAFQGAPRDAAAMKEMSTFFAHASTRLAQLDDWSQQAERRAGRRQG